MKRQFLAPWMFSGDNHAIGLGRAIGAIESPKISWLIAIILSVCLLIFTGCQSVINKNDGVIHLTLWHGINPPPNRDIFQKLVDHFNQTHPDIQVEALYVGQADQQLPKILTSIVGNAPPDILWFAPMLTGQLVDLAAVKPLENWLNQSPLKSEIYPSLFESMELNDHLWSVPMATNNVAVFYRPSLFKAAGISQTPKNWDEFRQVARQLTLDKNGDGKPEQYGMLLPLGKGEWTVFTWLPFLFSANGNLSENGKPNINNPGAIRALNFWSNLLKDGSANLSAPERGYELDGFLKGNFAMQLTGPWTLGQLQQTGVDFDVFAIPSDVKSATVVGGENLFIMKSSPERENAAWQFFEYILGQEFQTQWSLGTGYLPINMKAKTSPTYQSFIKKLPVLNVFLKQMEVARSRPLIAGYSRLSDNLGRAIEASLLGKPVEKSLEEAQARLDLIWEGK